jgi:hypothetical protein
MQAGNAQIGRTILAAFTAAVLVMSMVFLLANPAKATHVDPEPVGENANCSTLTGLVELTRFDPVPDGESTQDGVTIDVYDDGTVFDWSSTVDIEAVFVKGGAGGGGNLYIYDPAETSDTGLHALTNKQGQLAELSHITFCVPDTTTTTTVPEETTTTVPEETTTTVPEETTTTVPEETTTTVPEETTTTVPDEVRALVFVTVEGECVVDDGKGEGEITVTVSVDDAATIVLRDGDGDVVASVTADTVVSVPEDDTYTWVATPNEGFEFATDLVSTGDVEIETCTPDEVKDLEVLPFTGAETEALAVIAAVLSAIGLLVILATRRVEE